TGERVEGFEIPSWRDLLTLASSCYAAVSLGYFGADIVLDRRHGPLVLELNVRPGLSIQIANQSGLERRLNAVDAAHAEARRRSAEDLVSLAQELAASAWSNARRTAPAQHEPGPVEEENAGDGSPLGSDCVTKFARTAS